MADRIICMSKGRIEQIGTADDLYHRPDSLFVAGLHRLAADQSARRRSRERRPPRRRGQPPVRRAPGRARSRSASGPRPCVSATRAMPQDRRPRAARPRDHLPPRHALRPAPRARGRRRRPLPRRRPGQDRRRARLVFDGRRPRLGDTPAPARRMSGDGRHVSSGTCCGAGGTTRPSCARISSPVLRQGRR